MEIKQIKFGTQPRAYADHEWEWIVKLNDGEVLTDEIIKNDILAKEWPLKNALTKEDYFKAIRDKSLSFDERMTVVCKGYYYYGRMANGVYSVSARQAYID